MGSTKDTDTSTVSSKAFCVSAFFQDDERLAITIEKTQDLEGELFYDTTIDVITMLFHLLYMEYSSAALAHIKQKGGVEEDVEVADVELPGHRSTFLVSLLHDITTRFNNVVDNSLYSEDTEQTTEKLKEQASQSKSIFDSFNIDSFQNTKTN